MGYGSLMKTAAQAVAPIGTKITAPAFSGYAVAGYSIIPDSVSYNNAAGDKINLIVADARFNRSNVTVTLAQLAGMVA